MVGWLVGWLFDGLVGAFISLVGWDGGFIGLVVGGLIGWLFGGLVGALVSLVGWLVGG